MAMNLVKVFREALGRSPSLTIETIAIDQAGVGLDTIKAAVEGQVINLHMLWGTLDVGGTIKVSYDDDGAATNEVDRTGEMHLGANGGAPVPYISDSRFCLKAIAGKHLTLTTVGGKFAGYAIVSYRS